MKSVANPCTHKAIDKAQHAAPNNAAKAKPLETGEDELEVEKMLGENVRLIRENGWPNKAQGVQNDNKKPNTRCVGYEGCLHTKNNDMAIAWPMQEVYTSYQRNS